MILSMAAPSTVDVPRSASGCTCARLRRLTRRMTALYDRELAPTGLRLTQFSLLATLRREGNDGGVAVSDLAAAMDMDRTTLTRNLRPLLAQHLVELGVDPVDARIRRAAITSTGNTAFVAAMPRWRSAQDHVNRTLGEGNVAALHDWLDRVTPAFRAEPLEE
jgi:DNA-binding MarR family transcriptional regulator